VHFFDLAIGMSVRHTPVNASKLVNSGSYDMTQYDTITCEHAVKKMTCLPHGTNRNILTKNELKIDQ